MQLMIRLYVSFHLIFVFFSIVMRDRRFHLHPVASWSSFGRVKSLEAVPISEIDWRGLFSRHCCSDSWLDVWTLHFLASNSAWLIHQTIPSWCRLWNHRQQAQLVQTWWLYCFVKSARVLYCAISARFWAINDNWTVVNSCLTSGASARGGVGDENVRSCDIHSSLKKEKILAHTFSLTHRRQRRFPIYFDSVM